MIDATAAFFDELVQRGHEPLLRKVRGTVRFDLVQGDDTEWRYVTVDRGDLHVSKKRASADAVLRIERGVFDRLARGEINPIAALLRGELAVDGDWRLLVLAQRLFPGPPGARGPRRHAGWAKRHA
jgi:putative sterol carrier protein